MLPFAANARSERGRSFNDLLALEMGNAAAPAVSNQDVPRGDALDSDVSPEKAAPKTVGVLEIVREEGESRRSSFAVEKAEAPGGSEPVARGGVSGALNETGESAPVANKDSEQVRPNR